MSQNPPPDVTLVPATPDTPGPFLRDALCSCPHCNVLDEYPPEGARCPHCGNLLRQGLFVAYAGRPPEGGPPSVCPVCGKQRHNGLFGGRRECHCEDDS